ncbi:MAG: cytochrome c-type biogenesis CcmF C-terminal domain-containing protein [Chloroflexota bacterium]
MALLIASVGFTDYVRAHELVPAWIIVSYFSLVIATGLTLLMAVAPLSAWGATSLKRMGTALLVPLGLTAIALVLFAMAGMSSVGALIGYGLVTLAGFVALYEIYRGAAARVRGRGENPIFATLALMRRSSRRYGGYIIHIGIAVIGVGVIGSTLYQLETQQTLNRGESLQIGGYEMTYSDFEGGQITRDGRIMDIAVVTVTRNGREVAELRPRRDFFPEGGNDMNTMTIAGSHSTLENDFYVLLTGWERIDQSTATFKVYVNPLVNLVWWGSFILILGTMISTWPRDVVPARSRSRASVPSNTAMAAGD